MIAHAKAKPPKAPFPAFGGKSKVTPLVWERLGDVDNAIEPFFNSGAWTLGRPATHSPRIETVNDIDCYVANVWRATKHDPEAVAEHADNPVNEADLHARHRYLMLGERAAEFRERMRSDPDYYDARFAGYWCWGACCWIGSGWCQDRGAESEAMPHLGKCGCDCVPECTTTPRRGLSQQVPLLGQDGQGINVKPPTARLPRNAGRPQLADAYSRGRGVNGNDSAGTCAERRRFLCEWFDRLRDRLRTVRVCCGDWKRVCDSPSTTTRLGLTGIFLDPPYRTTLADGSSNRSGELYASDVASDVNAVVDSVIEYCKERGPDPLMRIAVCGYESEGYEVLETLGWDVVDWKASGGYGNQSGKVNDNSARERIWFSPHCLSEQQKQLF